MTDGHYFSSAPSGPLRARRIRTVLAGRELEVTTGAGVFSPDHLDTGTRVLLETVPEPPADGDLLDLGCGWGPVALTLALSSPGATVWAVDVNERALELTRRNAGDLGLIRVNARLPEDVPETVAFGTIWSNPPIRIGKAELHALLGRWLPRLAPDGTAWLVVQKNLGADSLHRWLDEEFPGFSTTRVASEKGFRVLRVDRD
ncbi:class I SAM-dependent methyltransferase [Naasia aerilata]|uniref:16S RNA G1207 methylase RsmC n=1 Tax=Naasia aerilata TaxID=1162966 RepID=A0ABN6XRF5_9MICO|nr:methyltransferase [Naasia aerilata]BDZ47577.1 16S RNA G1207 methylase RsmC [Naasia aerilata]